MAHGQLKKDFLRLCDDDNNDYDDNNDNINDDNDDYNDDDKPLVTNIYYNNSKGIISNYKHSCHQGTDGKGDRGNKTLMPSVTATATTIAITTALTTTVTTAKATIMQLLQQGGRQWRRQ